VRTSQTAHATKNSAGIKLDINKLFSTKPAHEIKSEATLYRLKKITMA